MKPHKVAFFAPIFDLYGRFATLIDNFERPMTSKVNETEKNKIKNKPTSV